jgi:hypothetical protein
VHLAAVRHRGPIDIHSRTGLFPAVRREVVKPKSRSFLDQYLTNAISAGPGQPRSFLLIELLTQHIARTGMQLSEFMPQPNRDGRRQLDYEITLCEDRLNVWEPLMMDIIDCLNLIWPSLSAEEKHYFHQEVSLSWLGRLANSMPLRNATIVHNLFERGQLRSVMVEELTTAKIDGYRFIINATGQRTAEEDTLLTSAANRGLLRFNCRGGVAIDSSNNRLHPDIPIYANGAIIQGEIFTANSIYSSVQGAQAIAFDLVRIASRTNAVCAISKA